MIPQEKNHRKQEELLKYDENVVSQVYKNREILMTFENEGDCHEKARNFLIECHLSYTREEIEKLYEATSLLISHLHEAPNYSIGFKESCELYAKNYTSPDDFVLIQFLEVFHDGFIACSFYSEEMHEEYFREALSYARESACNKELIKKIYG